MTAPILVRVEAGHYVRVLRETYPVFDAREGVDTVDPEARAAAEIVITSGSQGFTAAEMDALPKLGMISCVGTGYENVDIATAAARGVRVTHAAGTNAKTVADHAMGLLLAAVRQIPAYDASARAGEWRGVLGTRPMIGGKTVGIVGMGGIGRALAKRCEGFEMEVFYTATGPKPDLPWTYVADIGALAERVDILLIAAPGGPSTFHMVDAGVLARLGPAGYLVNVGRGSIVDTAALVDALREGTIAGAGLDVFENEPGIPPALAALPNVVLTPHIGGLAHEAQQATATLLVNNISAYFDGEAIPNLIPEMR
ncbi:NAD(P)-dependent oxidoreductase [Acuticoccus kandeliae]|uniref:NAD(P)-dependent oxidoreductase n=1 Tax=Acuticoccus kandeliae TaxID=2073160 RepID=UPI000D3E6A96|nr:NAD(P)-dependent oxidoreductase [Acuticoccus kandeliae]